VLLYLSKSSATFGGNEVITVLLLVAK